MEKNTQILTILYIVIAIGIFVIGLIRKTKTETSPETIMKMIGWLFLGFLTSKKSEESCPKLTVTLTIIIFISIILCYILASQLVIVEVMLGCLGCIAASTILAAIIK